MILICSLCALEIEIGALKINQNLFGNIKFEMNTVSVASTVWYKNFGFKVLVAKSEKTKNSIILDEKYTNKIDSLIYSSILYKYEINKRFSIITGVGYTSYETTWLVDNIKPKWSKDKDSDISYSVSLRYDINKNSAVELGYTDYYRKSKKGYGQEKTTGFNVSYIYKF